MPEQPLYQGARPNLGEGIHPLSSPTPGLQAAEESNKRFTSTLDAAEAQFFKLQDFGQRQKLEEQISAEISEFDREFLQRANLAPGSTGALYLKDGRLNETALDNLVYKYSARINQTRRHFVNSENAIEAAALRSENIERLKTRAFGQAAQQEITNVRRNFEGNLELSLTRKSYREAADIVDRAVDNGLITRTDADIRKQNITHDAEMEDAKLLLATNPDELNKRLNDQHYDNILSPLEQEELRRELTREGEQRKAAYLQNAHRKGVSGAKRKPSELVGYLTKKQYTWLQAVQSGDGANYERAITAGAIEEAACAPMNLSPEKWEAWRARYLAVYSELGMSKDFLNRQLQEAEERNKTLAYPPLPVKDILDRAEKSGQLAMKGHEDTLRAKHKKELKKWEPAGEMRKKHPYAKGDSAEQALEKYIQQELLPNHAAEQHADIFTRFNAWRTYNEEGQKASPLEQQEKLQSIIREVTGNSEYMLVDRAQAVAREVETARILQYNKFLTYTRRNPLNVHIAPPEQSELDGTISYDADPGKPFGILIPKGQAAGLTLENASITITYDDGTFGTLPIVGTCDGDSPMMTKAVADEFFANPRETRKVKWRVNKHASEQTPTEDDGIDPQGAADLEAYDEDAEEAIPVSDANLVAGTGKDPLANHNEPLPL